MSETFISKRRVMIDGKPMVQTRQYVSKERAGKKQIMAMANLKTGKQFRKFLKQARKHAKERQQ